MVKKPGSLPAISILVLSVVMNRMLELVVWKLENSLEVGRCMTQPTAPHTHIRGQNPPHPYFLVEGTHAERRK
jgi:hypothetical protein